MKSKKVLATVLSLSMGLSTFGTSVLYNANAESEIIYDEYTLPEIKEDINLSLGDIDGDSKVDATDASVILLEYSRLSTGLASEFTSAQTAVADVDGDGRIDSSDASFVLMYYAYSSTGGEGSFESRMKVYLGEDDPSVTTTTPSETTTTVTTSNRVSEIQVSSHEVTVYIDATEMAAYVTMLPESASNKGEIWLVSDESIATVDKYGYVVGKSEGECIVTVYSLDNPEVKAEIKVTVIDPNTTTTAETTTETTTTETTTTTTTTETTTVTTVDDGKIHEIQLSAYELTIPVGQLGISYVTMLPDSVADKGEIWSISDETIASVDENGWIYGRKAGTAIVTVRSANNPEVKAEIKVTVVDPNSTETTTTAETTTTTTTTTSTTETTATTTDPNKVQEIKLSAYELTIPVGQLGISYVTMLPDTATDKGEIWSISDETIASVDENGWIYGRKAGTATVTVKSASNPEVKAEIKVTIVDPNSTETTTTAEITTTTTTTTTTDPNKVQEIKLSAYELTIPVGQLGISYVTMLPDTATNKGEIWSISDETIASVDENGWIYGRKAGTATVTVKSASNPEVKAEIKVTIVDPNSTETTITAQTTTTTTTESATETTTTTTALNKVQEIQLSAYELTIPVGQLGISYVTMLPDTATNKGEIWSISDETIASVDENGWIYGRKAGTAIVTVQSADNPDVKAQITVTIIDPNATETTTAQTTIATTTESTATTTTATPQVVKPIVQEIILSDRELTIPVGEVSVSYITVLPSSAEDKRVTWSISDETIASVDENGYVYGRQAGTAIVTVQSVANSEVKAEITVTIV